MNGNFKARCIDTHDIRLYTKDKIYEIVDGHLTDGTETIIYKDLISIKDLQIRSLADWELVKDDVETNKTITINISDNKSTITDNNGIELGINRYYTTDIHDEKFVINELTKRYINELDRIEKEKNRIKAGDSVSITDTNFYPFYKKFIVDNAQELIDRMGLVEFSNLLLKFKSGDSPFFNIKYKVNLIAKHQNYNEELAIISNANNTFIINIDNLKKIDN